MQPEPPGSWRRGVGTFYDRCHVRLFPQCPARRSFGPHTAVHLVLTHSTVPCTRKSPSPCAKISISPYRQSMSHSLSASSLPYICTHCPPAPCAQSHPSTFNLHSCPHPRVASHICTSVLSCAKAEHENRDRGKQRGVRVLERTRPPSRVRNDVKFKVAPAIYHFSVSEVHVKKREVSLPSKELTRTGPSCSLFGSDWNSDLDNYQRLARVCRYRYVIQQECPSSCGPRQHHH